MTNSFGLARLSYVSCSRVDELSIAKIVEGASRKNPTMGLSGSLLYTGQYFFQTIEGPTENVDQMFARIRLDIRHFGVTPVRRQQGVGKIFDGWPMGYSCVPALDQFVAPLFGSLDQARADLILNVCVQALRRMT